MNDLAVFMVDFLRAFSEFLAYEPIMPFYALLLLVMILNIFNQIVYNRRF